MKIKMLPEHERPRERLLAKGAEALSDAELLAVLLRTGSKGKNAVELAQELLSVSGSLSKLVGMPLSQMLRTKGIGLSKAVQFKASIELARRSLMTVEQSDFSAALKNLQAQTAFCQKEMFYCVYLNAKNKVLKTELVATGTINASAIHPREIFKTAFAENACSIALVHNHPSGEIEPSEDDLAMTKSMKELCESLGVGLAGHFIVTASAVGAFDLK